MNTIQQLVSESPSRPPRLALRTAKMPHPTRRRVLVRVEATSVNPIDVKRAAGYGRRLLGLKGAARFPLVLGNDVAVERWEDVTGALVPSVAPVGWIAIVRPDRTVMHDGPPCAAAAMLSESMDLFVEIPHATQAEAPRADRAA